MQLKDYQNTAIKKLLLRSKELLEQSGEKKVIFKAPTGSGKTIMTAEFLKQLIDDKEIKTPLSFIWTAPRKLHTQSKEKLEKYYEDTRALECSNFEDLTDKQIGENEVLFLNWESINKKDKNTIVKENEKEFYLGKIVENTKEEGREVVLIIDESHHHATSEISQDLITDIAPRLTIEVSATPVISNPDEIVSVPLEDVKLEGMIKKLVILNPNFKNVLSGDSLKTTLADGTDAMVLEEGIKKRAEIAKAYKEAGIDINPLLLIQLPDRKTQAEDQVKNDVMRILKDKYGMTTENGKLAIYLSEEKENLENIAKNNHETEVLIFKQAIALGWDCPRAQVLVLFRDWKSLTFSVQTVGRIMRMPEPDTGHYKQEILNHGFVFTNLADIEIKEDMARNYVTIYTSQRIENYKPIKLESVYRLRQREKTRLSPKFINIFLDEAKKYDLEKKIETKGQKLELSLISDYEAEGVDKLANEEIKGEAKINTENEADLQKLYDYFVKNNLSPFYPEDRSIGRLKEAIYYFFRMRFGMEYTDRFAEIINIVLSPKNSQHFVNVIDSTKEKYIAETQKREAELQKSADWELPEMLNFGGNFTEFKTSLSAMKPFYYDNKWKTEEAFIEFLEKSDQIEWWFKNGDRDATFFAVPYIENEEQKPFYVDFIVKFKDGKIGLFDTKSGNTIKDAREKSDGLQEYVKKHKNISGGIVANTNSKDFSGRWMCYKGKGTELNPDDFSNWELLEI
ncbi:MAG: DEAD/DEAH box helicase family protein [Candidatus Delongbacteria bacterium]|nr:DEAD/DEAH box helicase family protein [Candidatus Delongbacteria bacterium]